MIESRLPMIDFNFFERPEEGEDMFECEMCFEENPETEKKKTPDGDEICLTCAERLHVECDTCKALVPKDEISQEVYACPLCGAELS